MNKGAILIYFGHTSILQCWCVVPSGASGKGLRHHLRSDNSIDASEGLGSHLARAASRQAI